jgi:hypothetical protein
MDGDREDNMKKLLLANICLACLLVGSDALAQNELIVQLPTKLYLPEAAAPDPSTGAAAVESLQALGAWEQVPTAAAAADISAQVNEFLQANAASLGLAGGASDLELVNQRETMVGQYLAYRQTLNGIPILSSQIALALNKEGELNAVTTNIVQVPESKVAGIAKTAELSEEAALDVAWRDLAPTGKLLEPARTELVYVPEPNALTLSYVVDVAVTQPRGYWRYQIDATTGRIIAREKREVEEGKRLGDEVPQPAAAASAPALDYATALQDLKARQGAAMAAAVPMGRVGSASALVFDPDPLTTLNDSTLADNSPATTFDPAYITVTLQEVTEGGGLFHLSGPTVRIEDFEPGEAGQQTSPSTSGSGWTARRGDNAFNDVMTYHYLQKSIAYLRQLGFTGPNELFPNGIAADSDGVSGDDNSHYVPPPSDRLAFGHGCVDDNEDVDVILHELGHAIHTHLNPAWGGGDMGAMGEGFGDYWATTYSLKVLPNGPMVDPAKVFTWDGIGSCWPGRRLDRTSARYNPSTRYGAHQSFGGFVSDELWSTPLYQALIELVARGETPESVDRIVLTGMQTVGGGLTMRQLALNTIAVANLLSPSGPHAAVFEEKFRQVGIVP